MKNGSLHGVTVLDLSRLLPGPYASMILADHGARVIHIEGVQTMGGDVVSTPLPTLYRNKEHMRLDLKKPVGRDIFHHLVKKADVVLEGFRPGVVEKLGIDYNTINKINPRIIYCSLTGYGQTGPGDKTGHDANFMAETGYLYLSAPEGKKPLLPPTQIADHAGGLYAAIGILLALFNREKTGNGQYIDVAIADSLFSLLSVPFTLQNWGMSPRVGSTVLGGMLACYDIYETADGGFITVAALEPNFFRNLCTAVNAEHLIPLHYDLARQNELRNDLASIFRTKKTGEWRTILNRSDACTGVIATLSEALTDENLNEREMILKNEKGPVIGIPVKLSETPGSVRTPHPERGAHTREILAEAGYSPDEVNNLFHNETVS